MTITTREDNTTQWGINDRKIDKKLGIIWGEWIKTRIWETVDINTWWSSTISSKLNNIYWVRVIVYWDVLWWERITSESFIDFIDNERWWMYYDDNTNWWEPNNTNDIYLVWDGWIVSWTVDKINNSTISISIIWNPWRRFRINTIFLWV